MQIDFEEFYSRLLEELNRHEVIYTRSKHHPNYLRYDGEQIYIRTNKSSPDDRLIPEDMIRTSFRLLKQEREVTQGFLQSAPNNVKRSAFIMAAFPLLDDLINYNPEHNSLRAIVNLND